MPDTGSPLGKDSVLFDDVVKTPEVGRSQLSDEELLRQEGDFAYTEEEVESYVLSPKISAEVRKAYDRRILPAVFLMYFCSTLDRGNLSNAKTDTLEKDLHLHGNQYNNILTAQSASYAAMAIAGGYLTRRFGAPRMLPTYTFCWGCLAIINASTKSYASATTVRFLLGCFEGFFGPSTPIYLTTFYSRGELGKRMAIWWCSSTLSGAFSGLLSYGVFHSKSSTLAGWQVLFLIEGGLTILIACGAFFVLPSYPQTAPFLTPKQREVAVMRLLKDASKEVNSEFKIKEFLAPLREWRLYVLAVFALCYGTGSATAQNFLAQIIQRFGYSKVITNLMTVGPNFAAMIYILALATLSDYLRQRAIFLAGALTTTLVGCAILAGTPMSAIGAGYFSTFLIACGGALPTIVFHSWHNNNDPTENGRAFRTGFLTFCANAGSLISSNIFLNSDAPKYEHALIIAASLQAFGIVIVLGMRTYMLLENRRRNRAQGVQWTSKDVPTADLKDGPKNPNFRFFL